MNVMSYVSLMLEMHCPTDLEILRGCQGACEQKRAGFTSVDTNSTKNNQHKANTVEN